MIKPRPAKHTCSPAIRAAYYLTSIENGSDPLRWDEGAWKAFKYRLPHTDWMVTKSYREIACYVIEDWGNGELDAKGIHERLS